MKQLSENPTFCSYNNGSPETEVYWYHPNYLGSVDLITDLDGIVHQFFLYNAWGESMNEYNAQAQGFDSPYRFNGKETDEETGLAYYGARYYQNRLSIWLSVDALAEDFPSHSPYNFTMNNPIKLVDPDGNAPGDPWQFGGSFRLTVSGSGAFNASVGLGLSYTSGDFMASMNSSLMTSNIGLGTRHGSTGATNAEFTLAGSLAATVGSGQASPLSLNTFANGFSSGVTNHYKSSGTVASNFVYSSAGGFQRVGYLGGRSGDAQFNFYNDIVPGLGSRGDEYWTGGGSLQLSIGTSSLTVGSDVFTGIRLGKDDQGKWLLQDGNPGGGKFGTYLQLPSEQELNNGQTYFSLERGGVQNIGMIGGGSHMYTQTGIHNHFSPILLGHGDPVFQSTADGL